MELLLNWSMEQEYRIVNMRQKTRPNLIVATFILLLMGVKTSCKILKDSNGAKKGAENKTGAEKVAKKGAKKRGNSIMGVPMTMTVAAEKVAEKVAKKGAKKGA